MKALYEGTLKIIKYDKKLRKFLFKLPTSIHFLGLKPENMIFQVIANPSLSGIVASTQQPQ